LPVIHYLQHRVKSHEACGTVRAFGPMGHKS
jgi:hypothetical protein